MIMEAARTQGSVYQRKSKPKSQDYPLCTETDETYTSRRDAGLHYHRRLRVDLH